MSSRSQFSNGFIKPPVESGAPLSRNEQLRRRINAIINSREHVRDVPVLDAQTAMQHQMEVAAAQAAKVVQKAAPIQTSTEVNKLPPDLVEYARQMEWAAQAEKAAAVLAAQQAAEQAHATDSTEPEAVPEQPVENVVQFPVKAKPEEEAARNAVDEALAA